VLRRQKINMWRGMKLSNSLLARSLSESSSSTFLWFSQSDSMSHTTTRICKIRLSALFAEARTRRLSSPVYTMALVGWPHFFNAFYIFSAFSCGVNGLYIASRLLHALASIRNVWPSTGWGANIKARLERTSSKGVPVNAVFVSWLFGLLGFLAVKPSPARVSPLLYF
jgi:amino acid permease